MEAEPRALALRILTAGQKPGTTLDRAIDLAGEALSGLSRQDRGLANAIVFGVLRHRGRIDHLIRAFSRIPVDRLDSRVLTLLRMGIFQLVYLDRVPDFAAIHATMELANARVNKKSRGFINAVLRQAADRHETVEAPDKKQFAIWLQVQYSVPSWLGKRWAAAYGKDGAEAIARAIADIPPLTLRTNTLKAGRQDVITTLGGKGIQAGATRISPLGIHIRAAGRSPADLPGFDTGLFQIQDEAAQLTVQALGPQPGERVLDACAGLGGKTCHMGQLMENSGQITAVDIDAGKLERLKTEAARLGVDTITTFGLNIRAATVQTLGGYFDRVLVDAPCTGLGVMRRNPDTRWKRTRQDILRMAARQKKLLNAAANLVTPGGTLVYAVCSCEPEETEDVVQRFLEKRKDYAGDPSGFGRAIPRPLSEPGAFHAKTYPRHTEMDGFFMARLKRKHRQ